MARTNQHCPLTIRELCLGVSTLALAASVASAQCSEKLLYPGTTGQPYFGFAIAQWGDDLVVGAPGGEGASLEPHGLAYHYRRTASGWALVQTFAPASAGPSHSFGASVGISGDTLLIGDSNHNPSYQAGAVHFYERTPSGFVLDQTIESPFNSDFFGSRSALDGDVAIVAGSFLQGPRIYERGPNGWMETVSISDIASVVALDGDVAVAARPACGGGLFVNVHVLERTATGWTRSGIAPPLGPNDCFGASVAVSGDVLMIGATQESPSATPPRTGLVHVYERGPGGWTETQTLMAGDGLPGYEFGTRVALEGGRALVTAAGPNGGFMFPGLVYVFERTGSGWVQTRRLQPQVSPNRNYGDALALEPGAAYIGDPRDPFTGGNPSGSVQVLPLPPPEARYCESTPNSTGSAAILFASGCTSIAANEVKLLAGPVPSEIGLFIFGTERTHVPLGNGTLCAGGVQYRVGIQVGQGALSHTLDLGNPLSVAGQITAGSTWYFQAWFRDFAGGGSFFDLSDAIGLTFGS